MADVAQEVPGIQLKSIRVATMAQIDELSYRDLDGVIVDNMVNVTEIAGGQIEIGALVAHEALKNGINHVAIYSSLPPDGEELERFELTGAIQEAKLYLIEKKPRTMRDALLAFFQGVIAAKTEPHAAGR